MLVATRPMDQITVNKFGGFTPLTSSAKSFWSDDQLTSLNGVA